MNVYALAAFLATLLMSARTRLTAVIAGQPVSIPVLWLVAAAILLLLAAAILWLLHSIAMDGGFRRPPRTVGA